MFEEFYEEFWPIVDPAIYAIYATVTFAIWTAIF